MYTVVLDPSINSAGVAIFWRGKLVAATTVRSAVKERKICQMARCVQISHKAVIWVKSMIGETQDQHFDVVCEWPQIYTVEKSEVPPKALIPMAGVSSAFLTLLWHQGCEATATQYLPGSWVMGTKKKDHEDFKRSSRGTRIASRLDPSEMQVWKEHVLTHDAMDAVGIGLYHLGRFKQRRTYLGAT